MKTLLLLLPLLFIWALFACGETRRHVFLKDNGAALSNPGMGWVFHYYDNNPKNYGSHLAPSDTLEDFPGLTVVYFRIPWSYIEPREGEFHWDIVDTPAQRWIDKGKRIAFRFTCSESWMRYATPEWVQKAGAKGYNFRPGKGACDDGPFWEPDYDDPVFLEKLDHFLAAAAKRYDGDPTVAFIDVGSFGVWGEGHTFASTQKKYPPSTIEKHIDLYCKHFKKTLLAANDDFSFMGDEAIEHAVRKGLTLRDDSILVQPGKNAYFHAKMADKFWRRLPVILESEHYGPSRDRGFWKDGSLYLQAVEDYHASYTSIHWWPREFLRENKDLIHKINMRLGYRLQVLEASWPKTVHLRDDFRFEATWRNAGVAPCLPGGFPCVTLKDAKGGIVAACVDEAFNARNLPVGAPGKAEARSQKTVCHLPFNARAGTYDLFISVGSRIGTPEIALPLPNDDGHRRYRIGSITVTGDFSVTAGALSRDGDAWRVPLVWTVHTPMTKATRPFFHFEQNGRIVFQGEPSPALSKAMFARPGRSEIACRFPSRKVTKPERFELKVGLWDPTKLGQPDERWIPDDGEPDRRVFLGVVEFRPDGTVSFEPRPRKDQKKITGRVLR